MIWSWSDYLDCYNLDSKKFIIASCTPTSVVYKNFFKTGYFSNDLIDLAIAVRKRDKNKFSKIYEIYLNLDKKGKIGFGFVLSLAMVFFILVIRLIIELVK